VAVVPDAFDERLFAPRDRGVARADLGLPAGAPLVAYAGMTFAHRWLDGLLEAATRLRAGRPGLTLLLVGGREAERADLRRRAEGLGLRVAEGQVGQPADVYLVGPRPQAEVLRYLAAADVLAIPDTVTDMTASPLKLFEYLALGTPLVLPAIAALHEIVPPELGYSFARRSVDGLSVALAAALDEAGDARPAARRAIARDHTYGRRAERILALVEQVRPAGAAAPAIAPS
jgi:glycosyltransferase involved in cell wall biosynthesis